MKQARITIDGKTYKCEHFEQGKITSKDVKNAGKHVDIVITLKNTRKIVFDDDITAVFELYKASDSIINSQYLGLKNEMIIVQRNCAYDISREFGVSIERAYELLKNYKG